MAQLCDAAEVVQNVKTFSENLPTTESHAAVLANLPPDQQVIVWKTSVEAVPNGKLTARHVRTVKNEVKKIFLTGIERATFDLYAR